MSRKIAGRLEDAADGDHDAEHQRHDQGAVPAARAALSGSPSPCRRADTAVRPTPTSSPIETITQTV